ncbi:MAG: magnesium transporter [Ectothiorhodospiraceae bacterium]|nr:magnesium transporter [Ectothiorhodospiraceae bacterium]
MLLVTETLEGFAQDMAESLERGQYREAAVNARRVSAARSARILAEAPRQSLLPFFQMIGWERAGRIVEHLPVEFAARVLEECSVDDAGSLLAAMAPEAIADVIERLPESRSRELLDQFDPDFLIQVSQLTQYPAGSAGAVMTPYFMSVPETAKVKQAVEAVREAPAELERGAYIYVVDGGGRPTGVISLRDLMLSRPETVISEAMHRDVLAARTSDSAVDAARRIRTRRLKLLPVVDDKDVLVGVIPMTVAMDLLASELADGFVALNAGSADESFFTPPQQAVRKRLPWMAANIFLNLGAVAVIASFEETLVAVAILAAFLPMITDMGGNVGIQALSVSIRSIALGEVRVRDFWVAMRKELIVGIFNGIALGALFTVVALIMQGNMVLGLVAGTALAVNVLVAGVVGGTIPFLIKRLGKDPAMMTGPVLTTITDITGVSIYLGLATIFLSGLLAGG